MNETDIKIECLRMANGVNGAGPENHSEVVKAAAAYYAFVTGRAKASNKPTKKKR